MTLNLFSCVLVPLIMTLKIYFFVLKNIYWLSPVNKSENYKVMFFKQENVLSIVRSKKNQSWEKNYFHKIVVFFNQFFAIVKNIVFRDRLPFFSRITFIRHNKYNRSWLIWSLWPRPKVITLTEWQHISGTFFVAFIRKVGVCDLITLSGLKQFSGIILKIHFLSLKFKIVFYVAVFFWKE